jgi:hypothetical protein
VSLIVCVCVGGGGLDNYSPCQTIPQRLIVICIMLGCEKWLFTTEIQIILISGIPTHTAEVASDSELLSLQE